MITVGVSVAIYLAWQIAHRGVFQYATAIYPIDDADEWRYTACSRLVEHGYRLFDQVFSAQPPGLFLSLGSGMRLFGDSIAGARWVEIVFGLVTVLCTAWIAWLLGGPVAGAAASVVLAVSPGFLVYSHTIEAEGPMMALATLSLALAASYRLRGWRAAPVLAGLALAAAVLTKLFAAEVALPALWMIAGPTIIRPAHPRRGPPGAAEPHGPPTEETEGLQAWLPARTHLQAAALFLAALLIPVALEALLVSPSQQWEQVVAMHNRASTLILPDLIGPADVLWRFGRLDAGLSLLALGGLISLLLRRAWFQFVFLCFWAGGTLAMLYLFRPLFPHHPAILLSGLAACAGVGVGTASACLSGRWWLPAAPVLAAAALYLAFGVRLAHADRHLLVQGEKPGVVQLASYVRGHAAPSDFVAADDLSVADTAGRLVPPPLCDPSNVRLRSGYLTASTLIGATEKYRAKLVVPSFGIFWQVKAYERWVRQHYRAQHAPGGIQVFVRR